MQPLFKVILNGRTDRIYDSIEDASERVQQLKDLLHVGDFLYVVEDNSDLRFMRYQKKENKNE